MNDAPASFRPVWIALVLLGLFLAGVWLVSASQQIQNCFERGAAPCMGLSGEQEWELEHANQ